MSRTWLAAVLVAALGLHLLAFLSYAPGDVVSVILGWWIPHLHAHGFSEPVGNYTPSYLYLLALLPTVDSLANGIFLVKLLSLAGAAWLAFACCRVSGNLNGLAVLALPSVVLNASLLGQADCFWVAPCILAFAAAVRRDNALVAIWSGVAFAFKAQAIFFAPFVISLFWRRDVPLRLWLIPPLVYIAACVPAWLSGWPASDLLTIYLRQAQWQPDNGTVFISNGASWWTWFGYAAPRIAIHSFLIGFVTAAAGVFAYWRFIDPDGDLFAPALVSAAGLPFLLPGMHERFFILSSVLAFLYAFARPSRRTIVAAVLIELASAGPVFIWAFRIEPLQILAAPLMLVGLFLVAKRSSPSDRRKLSDWPSRPSRLPEPATPFAE